MSIPRVHEKKNIFLAVSKDVYFTQSLQQPKILPIKSEKWIGPIT